MKTYTLTKTQKGKRYLYEVKDEAGKVISKRLSTRGNYVACSVSGEYYFGRLDLIGKGNHGAALALMEKYLHYTGETWEADRQARAKELRMCVKLECNPILGRTPEQIEEYRKECADMLEHQFNPANKEQDVKIKNELGKKWAEELQVVYLK